MKINLIKFDFFIIDIEATNDKKYMRERERKIKRDIRYRRQFHSMGSLLFHSID